MPVSYVKRFSNNNAPRNLPAITVDGAMMRSVAVGFPSTGTISRVTVKQSGGTPCAVNIELLDSKIPYPPGEYALNAPPADDLSIYRIMPPLSGTSGVGIESIANVSGWRFQNQDGGFASAQRFIYLLIQPQAAPGLTTWDVAITGEGGWG